MKKIMIALAVIFGLATMCSADKYGFLISPVKDARLKNNKICIGRDTETIPGKIIYTWKRGNGDTWCTTNVQYQVLGAKQNNKFQNELESARIQLAKANAILAAATNNVESVSSEQSQSTQSN